MHHLRMLRLATTAAVLETFNAGAVARLAQAQFETHAGQSHTTHLAELVLLQQAHGLEQPLYEVHAPHAVCALQLHEPRDLVLLDGLQVLERAGEVSVGAAPSGGALLVVHAGLRVGTPLLEELQLVCVLFVFRYQACEQRGRELVELHLMLCTEGD